MLKRQDDIASRRCFLDLKAERSWSFHRSEAKRVRKSIGDAPHLKSIVLPFPRGCSAPGYRWVAAPFLWRAGKQSFMGRHHDISFAEVWKPKKVGDPSPSLGEFMLGICQKPCGKNLGFACHGYRFSRFKHSAIKSSLLTHPNNFFNNCNMQQKQQLPWRYSEGTAHPQLLTDYLGLIRPDPWRLVDQYWLIVDSQFSVLLSSAMLGGFNMFQHVLTIAKCALALKITTIDKLEVKSLWNHLAALGWTFCLKSKSRILKPNCSR